MPFRRENRRVPTYVGVRIENNKIVIPTNMEENDNVLKGWRKPTSRVMGIKPPTYYVPPPPDSSDVEAGKVSQDPRKDFEVPNRSVQQDTEESSELEESENDSEASTTEESGSEHSGSSESETETSQESVTNTSIPKPVQPIYVDPKIEIKTDPASPKTKKPRVRSAAAEPIKPPSPIASAVHEPPAKPLSLARYTTKLELSLEFTDLIFETSLQNYGILEKEENRSILTVEHNLEEDALSVYPSKRSPESLSVSKIYDSASDSDLISLYDLQRLIGFIAGSSLTDKQKARLNKQLDDDNGRRLVPTDIPLFHTISVMRNPKPYVRVTFPVYVVPWKDVDGLLTRIFEADGVCVTVL